MASVVTSSSLTVSTGDTIIVKTLSQVSTAPTISDGNNTYSFAGNVTDTGAGFNAYWFYCLSAAAGTYAVTATENLASSGHAVMATQYRGLGNFQGFSGVYINGPGAGANTINTGTAACTNAPAMVWGSGLDFTDFPTPTYNSPLTGTSPLAFTGRAGFWNGGTGFTNGLSEDIRVFSTGNYAGTFGADSNSQFDQMFPRCDIR